MPYIHDRPDWPRFRWSADSIAGPLADIRHRQGRLIGRMESLGFDMRSEAVLRVLTEDVVKSSEIEGETLDRNQVRSSIARRLGMDIGALIPVDRHVDGVVEMMLDATQHYAAPLTEDRLFAWHGALFPTGRSGLTRIATAAWRPEEAGPMQVVSGDYGHERVHFEAPDATRVPAEMRAFLDWFNTEGPLDGVLRAALAHFWFITIHPFEDGNGRIARAIADMVLARSEDSPQRFYSMSAQIRADRAGYYAILERSQRGDLDIGPWILWFLDCLGQAFTGADRILTGVLTKARFWEGLAGQPFNPRQRDMLNRLLDGFEGHLTTSKWAGITGTSSDTALRDITDLAERGILARADAGGRSTHYRIVLPQDSRAGR